MYVNALMYNGFFLPLKDFITYEQLISTLFLLRHFLKIEVGVKSNTVVQKAFVQGLFWKHV